MAKLDIANEMAKFDQKDRDFYDSLDEEEKKKFSTYLMIRWGSCVGGSEDIQAYYLMSTNQKLNKNFFAVNKTNHDKLNWLTATTVSPGMGTLRHQWLSLKKKEGPNAKVRKFFAKLYPMMKDVDLDNMAKINDLKEVKKFAEDLGMTKEQIKKELG